MQSDPALANSEQVLQGEFTKEGDERKRRERRRETEDL